jgi:hypothetical protein
MNTKLVAGFTVLVLLFGLASHSLVNSAFAQDAAKDKAKTDAAKDKAKTDATLRQWQMIHGTGSLPPSKTIDKQSKPSVVADKPKGAYDKVDVSKSQTKKIPTIDKAKTKATK